MEQNISEVIAEPSSKYSYPVQWMFKHLVFLCIHKIWLKQLLLDAIDREAITFWADADPQNYFSVNSIMLKTT